MKRHLLDRAVWNALSTQQTNFAVGGDRARRFAPDIGSLAAACDDSTQSLEALAELIPAGGKLILLQAEPIALPPGVDTVLTAPGVQMVLENFKPVCGDSNSIQRLDEEDIPEMLALAMLTKPGPFEIGTPKLGEFWGIKERGKLLAMAGERMKHSGYSEVSGVCTHPEARGRGFARALSAKIAERILERGDTPYLHAYAGNRPAIQLYESLGFRLRCPVHVAIIALRRTSH